MATSAGLMPLPDRARQSESRPVVHSWVVGHGACQGRHTYFLLRGVVREARPPFLFLVTYFLLRGVVREARVRLRGHSPLTLLNPADLQHSLPRPSRRLRSSLRGPWHGNTSTRPQATHAAAPSIKLRPAHQTTQPHLLAWAIGRRQAAAAPILVHRRPSQQHTLPHACPRSCVTVVVR